MAFKIFYTLYILKKLSTNKNIDINIIYKWEILIIIQYPTPRSLYLSYFERGREREREREREKERERDRKIEMVRVVEREKKRYLCQVPQLITHITYCLNRAVILV